MKNYPKTALTTTQLVQWLRSIESTAFWQEMYNKYKSTNTERLDNIAINCIYRYADLMQTELSLEMFVPCKDGEILEKPLRKNSIHYNWAIEILGSREAAWKNHTEIYQQVKENVLFENWHCCTKEISDFYKIYNNKYEIWMRKADNKDITWRFVNRKGEGNSWKAIVNFEDLIRQVELTPTANYWKLIFE